MTTLKRTSRFSTEFAWKIAIPAPLMAFAVLLGMVAFAVLCGVLVGLPPAYLFHESSQLLIALSQFMAIVAIVAVIFVAVAGFGCWCLSLANRRGPLTALLSLAFRLATRDASFCKAGPYDAGSPSSPPANRVTLLTPAGFTGASPLLE